MKKSIIFWVLVVLMSAPMAHAATTITTSTVDVVHPIEARLLGIIDTTLVVHTRMESDGSFFVDYPWYGFIFSTNRAQLETKLQAVGKAVEAWNTSSFSVAQQSTLSNLLEATLESTSTVPQLQ